jgi:hypothetical protein
VGDGRIVLLVLFLNACWGGEAGGVALCTKNGTIPISAGEFIGALLLTAVLNVRFLDCVE